MTEVIMAIGIFASIALVKIAVLAAVTTLVLYL